MATPSSNVVDYVKTYMMNFGSFSLQGLNEIMNERMITSSKDRKALKEYLLWLHGRVSGCHIPEPKDLSRHH